MSLTLHSVQAGPQVSLFPVFPPGSLHLGAHHDTLRAGLQSRPLCPAPVLQIKVRREVIEHVSFLTSLYLLFRKNLLTFPGKNRERQYATTYILFTKDI